MVHASHASRWTLDAHGAGGRWAGVRGESETMSETLESSVESVAVGGRKVTVKTLL